MSDTDFTFKEGTIVSIRAEVIKPRSRAETEDGAVVEYYVLKVNGNSTLVIADVDQVKAYEQPRFRVRSLDVNQTASTIGANIRRYRKTNNISQQQLADALSVKQAAVSLWEHGRTTPRSNIIPALLEILNISIDDLYGEDERTPKYKHKNI